jgi:hypothetical protein
MRIHTKILRKPLNKIRIKALKFLGELGESQNLQRGIFRPVICPEVFLPFCEEEYRFLVFCYLGFPLGLRTEREILL